MVIFYATMTAIRKHYDRVAEEIAAPEGPTDDSVRPSRVHSVVLISKIHRPTLRALAYAKLMRSDTLEALSVNVDPAETKALQEEWERRGHHRPAEGPRLAVPRDHPAGHRVRQGAAPGVAARRRVSVIIPEYVVGHWYEQLLHNQSALRLKGRLLFTPGVMVTSVPYQLESSEVAKKRARKRRTGTRRDRCGAGPPRSGARTEQEELTGRREPTSGAGSVVSGRAAPT